MQEMTTAADKAGAEVKAPAEGPAAAEKPAAADAAAAEVAAEGKGPAPERAAAEEKPPAETKAASGGKRVLENGVCGCFAVVSSAVRKGKGRGKVAANPAGGYVPAHMRDPTEPDPEVDAAAAVGGEDTEGGIAGGSMGSKAPAADAADAAADPAAAGADAEGAGGLAGGASFDSNLGLSAGGSFDAELGDSGNSVRKRAKRWQRRSASSFDLTGADAAAGSTAFPPGSPADAAAEGEPLTKYRCSAGEVGSEGADVPMGSPGPDCSDFPPPSPAMSDGFPPASPAFPPPTPMPEGPATLAKLPVAKLKSLARYHGVNLAGCLEKSDMVDALRKAGIDDAAAEKEAERARAGATSEQPPRDMRSEAQKENDRKAAEHAAKRAAAAEERAAAAEAEMKRLREELEAAKTSSRKKWSPAFQSTAYIPGTDDKGQDSGFPPRSPSFNMGGGARGPSGFAGGMRPPMGQGGVDLRNAFNGCGSKGGQKGDNDPTCWEFKQGRCSKGTACKWRHA